MGADKTSRHPPIRRWKWPFDPELFKPIGFLALLSASVALVWVMNNTPGINKSVSVRNIETRLLMNSVPRDVAECMAPGIVEKMTFVQYRHWGLHTNRAVLPRFKRGDDLDPRENLSGLDNPDTVKILLEAYNQCATSSS